MPVLTEYKALPTELKGNSFCNSLIFLSFCSKFNEDEQFGVHFMQLFGETGMMLKLSKLQKDFNTYQNSGIFPASLPKLVQEYFLPNLANYLREQGKFFLLEPLWEQIEPSAIAIEQGQIDMIAQQALAHLLQIQVQVYTQNAQHLAFNEMIGGGELCVSIVKDSEQYQPLVNINQLTESQKQGLQSLPTMTFHATPTGVNTHESFTEEALIALIHETMRALPEHMAAISKDIPAEPMFQSMAASHELSLLRLDYPLPNLPLRDITSGLELPALYKAYESAVALFDEEKVGLLGTWQGSLGLSLVGSLGAGAGITGMALFAGGAVAAGAVAISVACIPVFVACALLTIVGAPVGAGYANAYKEALKVANKHIMEKNYGAAVTVLDKEFNRFIINRTLRSPFLTKAHYAVAHFFRGLCAELIHDPVSLGYDVKKAYVEYQQALNDAKQTDAKIVILLLHMKLIQLLRRHGQALVSPKEIPEILIKEHLTALNRHFNQSLTHLYWQARMNMTLTAVHCYQQTTLTPKLLNIVKGVLNIESLFMLDGYQEGRGNYLQVFHSFFQALTIAFVHFKHPQEQGRLGLNFTNGGETIAYIFNKLSDTFSEFNAFKAAYPDLANQSAFKSCHEMMKKFALDLGGLLQYHLKSTISPDVFSQNVTKLATVLNVKVEAFHAIASRYALSTDFLMRIEEEFGLHFESINAWVLALNDPKQACFKAVSTKTQNNMLHMLAHLPKDLAEAGRVKDAAKRMREMIYVRNHENHTPLSLLAQQDNYGIQVEINPPKLISLGTGLNEMDQFIKGVEENVGHEGHFILLQGPPGTGKTEAVLTHLRSTKHSIVEWEGGGKDDKYVNQLEHRVIKFFKDAIELAKKNLSPHPIILFIDEISSICPQVNGVAENGHHNQAAVVEEFQKQISALKGHNVVLVGATNYPERLSKAIQNRMMRVAFPSPDQAARKKLLNHLLREKRISNDLITKVASLTQGWSPRQLVQMVETIKQGEVLKEDLSQIFEKSCDMAQKDFRTEFKCAQLMLTQFDAPEVSSVLVQSDQINKAFIELMQSLKYPELYKGSRMHTLLYGPPGSGKTTAIREFAKQNNCPFILIESGTNDQDFISIFERAKSYTSAIICIDEIDRLAFDGSPVRVFLQEQMDGLVSNNIVIVGATNYPDQIAEAIFSRFAEKVPVPLPTHKQVGLFIQEKIAGHLVKIPNTQMDQALQQAMAEGCLQLGSLSESLSYRDLSNSLNSFFANITLKKTSLISETAITECIQRAIGSTRDAVLVQASAMAAPRFRGQFFGDIVNTQVAAQPAASYVTTP